MSYYGSDDNDPNRSAGGQFYNHLNANIDEQWVAGVNSNDNYMTAHLKTEDYRRRNNQDLFTGVPLPAKTYGGTSGGSTYHHSSSGSDDSQIGEVLGSLIKMILWVAVAVFLAAGAGVGAIIAGRSMDGPTLTARAAQGEFASYQPAPLSKYFGEKELASPIEPAGFVAAFHGVKKGSDMKKAVRPVQGMAYRCMLQPGCRDGVAKLDPELGRLLPRAAGNFLLEPSKAGREDATRDACLFAAKFGTSYKDLLTAFNFCSQANYEHKGTKAGAEAMSLLYNSWAFNRAHFYDLADQYQYGLEHASR